MAEASATPRPPDKEDAQAIAIYLCCSALAMLEDERERAEVVKYLHDRYGPAGSSTLARFTKAIQEELDVVNNALLKTQGLPIDVAMDMTRVTAPIDRMKVLTTWARKAALASPVSPAVSEV